MKLNFIEIDNENLLEQIDNIGKVIDIVLDESGMKVYAKKGDKLKVKYDGESAYITYPIKAAFFRALNIFTMKAKNNKVFEVEENICFDECGVMLDMSRNAVMRVEKVKEYASYMAVMGLNQLYLYMEDTYTIDGLPYFGYMRGRYTKEELCEIDNYCDALGIEVIPHIQTLGHLHQYIKWAEGMKHHDCDGILMAEEDATYELIRKMIGAVSSCFKTKKIHIGMDEAAGLGNGRYYAEHGPVDKIEILLNHYKRVYEIVEEFGLTPAVYGDVFFNVISKNKENDEITSLFKNTLENTVLTYWNYYDNDYKVYDDTLKKYSQITKNIVFWGGISLWYGFAPDNKFTLDNMGPALMACKNNNVKKAIGSIWGDNGCECNYFFSLFGMQYFAEHMYNYEVLQEKFNEIYEHTVGMSAETAMNMSYFHNDFDKFDNYSSFMKRFNGKRFLWCDILVGLMDKELEEKSMSSHYKRLEEYFSPLAKKEDKWQPFYIYIHKLFDVLYKKCYILEGLKKAYDEGDKEFLNLCVQKLLPELTNAYATLREIHQKQWMENNKAFGFEVLDIRYGGLIQRIKTAQNKILEYLNGEINTIEELDAERLLFDTEGAIFAHVVTPCMWV